jgi:hypothetical protein
MIQRRGLDKARISGTAIYVDAETLLILYLKQLQFVDELPMPPQTAVCLCAQRARILVGKMGL